MKLNKFVLRNTNEDPRRTLFCSPNFAFAGVMQFSLQISRFIDQILYCQSFEYDFILCSPRWKHRVIDQFNAAHSINCKVTKMHGTTKRTCLKFQVAEIMLILHAYKFTMSRYFISKRLNNVCCLQFLTDDVRNANFC